MRDGANAFDDAGGDFPLVRTADAPSQLLHEAGEACERLNEAAA